MRMNALLRRGKVTFRPVCRFLFDPLRLCLSCAFLTARRRATKGSEHSPRTKVLQSSPIAGFLFIHTCLHNVHTFQWFMCEVLIMPTVIVFTLQHHSLHYYFTPSLHDSEIRVCKLWIKIMNLIFTSCGTFKTNDIFSSMHIIKVSYFCH